MDTRPAKGTLVGWDELELEKVTELISRKVVEGDRVRLAQVYLKRGALVPLHAHDGEQMTYVLDGLLKVRMAGAEVLVRDGEVVRVPSGVPHQIEALADTFQIDLLAPTREDTNLASGPGRPSRRARDRR